MGRGKCVLSQDTDSDVFIAASSAAEIDCLLARAAETSRKLRQARNSFSPINRIPVELLSAIFLLLLPDSFASAETTFFAPLLREWYKVTHVCQRWRAIALECKLLWTQLDLFAGPTWVERMLDRAGNASLVVKTSVSRPSEGTMEALTMAVAHLRRAQTLHLSIDKSTFERLLPASIFENIELLRLHSLVLSNISLLEEVMDLPTEFFKKGAPRLERLELQQFSILSWDMPLLFSCPLLKTLHLRSCQSIPPTLTQLLHILRSMPLLEDLHLINILPVGVESTRAISSSNVAACTMSLPKLRILALCGNAPEVARFLNHVQLPPRVTTSISCRSPADLSEFSPLCTLLTPLFAGHGETEPHRGLDLSINSTRIRVHTAKHGVPTRLSGWTDFGSPGSVLFTLGSGWASVDYFKEALTMLTRAMPLQHVTALSIEDDRRLLDPDTFGELLQATAELTTLQVCQEAGIYLPEVLTLPADSHLRSSSPCPRLILPKLEHLLITAADLSWTANHSSLLCRLQEAQFQRCEGAQPIPKLSIERCYDIREEEVKVLCQLFVDVYWDGFQMCWSDDDYGSEYAGDEDDALREMREMWDGGNIGWHS